MPLFEFRCPNCTSVVELLVPRDEHPDCPRCAGARLERLMSAAAIGASARALPIASGCPPLEAGPCSPTCCRLP